MTETREDPFGPLHKESTCREGSESSETTAAALDLVWERGTTQPRPTKTLNHETIRFLFLLQNACAGNQMCIENGLSQVLAQIASKMGTILGKIRSTGYKGIIVMAN